MRNTLTWMPDYQSQSYALMHVCMKTRSDEQTVTSYTQSVSKGQFVHDPEILK